jgi:hypothetical protein
MEIEAFSKKKGETIEHCWFLLGEYNGFEK